MAAPWYLLLRHGHSPHGECGLKSVFLDGAEAPEVPVSPPAWGVRVEMSGTAPRLSTTPTSLPAWGVRVEIRSQQ